jgi:hypothetical protein
MCRAVASKLHECNAQNIANTLWALSALGAWPCLSPHSCAQPVLHLSTLGQLCWAHAADWRYIQYGA